MSSKLARQQQARQARFEKQKQIQQLKKTMFDQDSKTCVELRAQNEQLIAEANQYRQEHKKLTDTLCQVRIRIQPAVKVG
jgi:hypothetical protein